MNDITDNEVRDLPLSAGRAELLEEIMSTPLEDALDQRQRPDRRPPGWLVAVVAAAAVIGIVALPVWLGLHGSNDVQPSGQPGVVACWDGATTATCTSPSGKAGLEWALPRLQGHLDQCDPINASGRSFDGDLPMTFGTPTPGDGAAYRCTLADLGVASADPSAPAFWVYAFGDDNGKELRDYFDYSWAHPKPLTLAGEAAGKLIALTDDEVGLVRPDGMFMAAYDDFPFAVIGYASTQDEAIGYLKSLGMRPPSELTGPGPVTPELPDFPGGVLLAPEASPGAGSPGAQPSNGSATAPGLLVASPTS